MSGRGAKGKKFGAGKAAAKTKGNVNRKGGKAGAGAGAGARKAVPKVNLKRTLPTLNDALVLPGPRDGVLLAHTRSGYTGGRAGTGVSGSKAKKSSKKKTGKKKRKAMGDDSDSDSDSEGEGAGVGAGAGEGEGVAQFGGVTPGTVKADALYLDALVEMVPSSHYLPKSDKEKEETWSKYHNATPKQAVKEASKKAKKARYDLEARRTVAEEQEDFESELTSHGAAAVRGANAGAGLGAAASGTGTLKELLHAKIEALRAARGVTDDADVVVKKREPKAKRKGKTKAKTKASATPTFDPHAVPSAESLIPTVAQSLQFSLTADPGTKIKRTGRQPSLQKLLAKAKENRERLEELKALNGGSAPEAMWDAAVKKAGGEKVKDDPKLLAKTLKKKMKKKEQSKKKWEMRKETVKNDQAERQRKRTENLKARSDKKVAKKLKRAGFEGKRKTFLS